MQDYYYGDIAIELMKWAKENEDHQKSLRIEKIASRISELAVIYNEFYSCKKYSNI